MRRCGSSVSPRPSHRADLLLEPSAALIGPGSPSSETLFLHIRCKNRLVRNFIVGLIQDFRALQDNQVLKQKFDASKAAGQPTSEAEQRGASDLLVAQQTARQGF